MKTSNRNSAQFANKLLNFQANNLHGINEGKFYIVYSYNWYPLFLYEYSTGTWYENSTKYSVSTSKQKTQVRPTYSAIERTYNEIKQML
jgi:hypothetical protein